MEVLKGGGFKFNMWGAMTAAGTAGAAVATVLTAPAWAPVAVGAGIGLGAGYIATNIWSRYYDR